ncbi:MAG: hypothetical protein A2Z72_00035 [Omnitrophica bacterium RBG_13_46_9]|nr:MAG: hypothetical protein A2Z72_00035 [Omnitrophica bacterium RBG_13_46_9]
MDRYNFRKVAIEAALKAGGYIKRNLGKARDIRYKGEINIVTEIDKKAEDIIVSEIKKVYPKHSFIAEEDIYAKNDLDFTWIIDPLDGTTNFIHSFPFFCVSVSLMRQGSIVVGAVYDPMRDELFHAERGKGAFLNRQRICVSKLSDIKKAMVATGFAYNVKKAKNNNVNNFINFLKASQAVRRAGSAALDMCYVGCGRFDGFWELYLHPWDTAAASLIVEEAGGKVTKFDGSEYKIFDKETLATNSKLHSCMVKILSK